MLKPKFRIAIGMVAIPIIAVFTLTRCGSSSSGASSSGTSVYLYIASGNSFAGNNITPYTPANVITRFNIAAGGTLDRVVMDYTVNQGDTPVGMVNYDSKHLLVAVENATNIAARRIDLVNKDGSGYRTFVLNSTAFNVAGNIINDLAITPDGGVIVARTQVGTSAIEKFTSTQQRIVYGASPFINNPQGVCVNSNQRLQHVVISPQGNIIVAQPFLNKNNLIMVNQFGYQVSTDCFAQQAVPSNNAYPSALLMHSSGHLLAGYSSTSTTPNINSIYAYTGVTSNTFTATGVVPISIYSNQDVIQGISAMAEKIDDTSVFVASSGSTANTLFQFNDVAWFTYNSTTGAFTQNGTTPIVAPSVYTRSISAMVAPADGP
jgi:hypothetical protein